MKICRDLIYQILDSMDVILRFLFVQITNML